MTTIRLARYSVDGIGTIEFADGTTGTVGISLQVDRRPLVDENFITGREDLIADAVRQGNAELRLADGVHLTVSISPRNKRYASIRVTNADLAAPNDDAVLENEPVPTRSMLAIFGTGRLIVNNKIAGPVTFEAQSLDGCIPRLFAINGDPELIKAAHQCETVGLELSDTKLRAKVDEGWDNNGALMVDAESVVRAMARRFKELRW